MKSIDGVGLNEVTSVYSGPQRDLYTLLMGQQLHVGASLPEDLCIGRYSISIRSLPC
jgi:hypothetical protein